MGKNIKNKILASILVFILVLANFQGIITEGITVLASSIENQTCETNHKNVDFNAQFMVINNEKKYSIRENISNKEIYLNIFAEVKEAGYLKSGKIEIKDEDGNSPNFNLIEIEEPDAIQYIDYINNEITLNQINNGEKLDVNLPISLNVGETFNLETFSKNTIITFNGVYIDGEGKEKNIEKEIKLKVEWKEEIEATLTQETVKVLPYEVEETKGIVITEKVKLGIKDLKLPIKSANIEVIVPKISEVLPTEVRVESINTSLDMSKEYEDGILEIVLQNNISEDNTVSWNKTLEELDITYIFKGELAENIGELQSIAKLKIECYSSEKTEINTESINIVDISNKLGNSIENTLISDDVIYKGNMLHTTNETEFTVTSNIDIAYEKLIEKIEVSYSKDKFVINNKDVEAKTYYKKINVSKENFNKILGETGELKIYSGNTLLGIIDNNCVVDENDNFAFNFEKNLIKEIKLEGSKPIYSGILKVEFLKAIGETSNYTKEEIKNITNLKLETIIDENKKEQNIQMENPITKITLNTNTNILSTVIENKGVEFAITLNNNSLNADLFKNPKIELCLPEAVTDVKINSAKLLLEDELVLTNYEYVNNTNSIIVNLEGLQTKYNLSEMQYGAILILNTDITLDKLAVNKKDKVKLFVVNEAVTSYESVLEEKGYTEKDINIIAPLGLIALNSAEGYNEEQDKATSISGNEAVGKIEPNAENKITTMRITAINNYDSVINNIRILGRVPFSGNKSLIDGSDLGTTFDAILKEKISSELVGIDKYEVYYSDNGDATEDLSEQNNGWTLEPLELSIVKSYLIILKDYEMQIGEKIEFKYEIEVPADLELGNSAHGTYIVYYNNKKDDIVHENTTAPAVVELTTGEAPKLEISLNSDIAQEQVAKCGQIIKYTIKVKNVGEIIANQVFVTAPIPENLTYVELVVGGNYKDDYYSFNSEKRTFNKLLGDIEPGQEQIVEYLVRVNEDVLEQKEIKVSAKVSAKDLPEMVESSELTNLIASGNIIIELKSDVKTDEKVKVGDIITYTAKINNISVYDLNNVIAKVELPEGIEYKESNENANYNKSTRTLEWSIDKLQKDTYIELVFKVVANSKKENLTVFVNTLDENKEEHKSNSIELDVCQEVINVKQETTIPEGYVSSGDKIEYNIEVQNTGNLDARNVQIIDFIPEGMKYLETSYIIKGINKTIKTANSTEAKLELNIPANETVSVAVKVKAKETEKDIKATNIVKVINDGVEIEANTVTHTIEAKTLGNIQNGTNNIELVNTYKISGTAWWDKNENGAKDNEEDVLAGITVMLLDKTTGQIAKDANGQEQSTTTEGTGNYTFRNLNKGEYIVVFIYDNSKYVITDYKKPEVEESKNSDVVNMKISMNEQEKSVAVSDTINIVDQNIYNINIGLKEIGKFDLKLNKYVSKITVSNKNGKTTYDYTNTELAKIELNSKTANDSTLIIEYKITVTNEGSVAGYVKKVVDYIPQELKFSSELNNSWYMAEDGNVYSSELANTKINPGESRDLIIILTKQITGENIGLINNNAEIVESYNDYGIDDIDSTAGNKQTNEEDMSNADIYIGIKTGSAVTYIGLSLAMMIVLALGAYFINEKVLMNK